jgi:hypothetical protein
MYGGDIARQMGEGSGRHVRSKNARPAAAFRWVGIPPCHYSVTFAPVLPLIGQAIPFVGPNWCHHAVMCYSGCLLRQVATASSQRSRNDKERNVMSKKETKAPSERDLLISNLRKTWKDGVFTGMSKKDLIWLGLVAAIRAGIGKRPMNEILNEYRKGYEDSKTPNGRASKRCGDELSVLLTGMDGDEAIKLAEKLLALEEGLLMEKYESLNEGQRRMNAGNRIRGSLKREDITIKDVKAAIKAA